MMNVQKINNKKSKQKYYNNKKIKCPCCGNILEFEDLIEVGKTKDKQNKIIIDRKLKELGYEFGLLDD